MTDEFCKEIQDELRAFITIINAGCGVEVSKSALDKILENWQVELKNAYTTYYPNKRDIDRNIESMKEKFCFHGLFREADILGKIYNDIITDDLPKNVLMDRLSFVKFLLSLSETPTKKLLDKPFVYKPQVEESAENIEEINWSEYLNEGIEKWEPNFAESEESDLESELDESFTILEPQQEHSTTTILPVVIKSNEKFCTMDLKTSRDELTALVQHTWYHSKKFHMEPESHHREANIGILWDEHIREQVSGLVLLDGSSIISEYLVIREILWQLWSRHTSTAFELCGNTIKPKSNVTIASVRQSAFYKFLEGFIPYIELLHFFREFEEKLGHFLDDNESVTYRCYNSSLNDIIKPIKKKLCDIESAVQKQETTYTLLNLAQDLEETFEPLKILKEIHAIVILDRTRNSSLKCATYLLTSLHNSLHLSVNKLEQDLKVTLFLQSTYYYLGLIDSWFHEDNLSDYSNEFVIEKRLDSQNLTYFVTRDELDDNCKNNTFLKVILDRVLRIGRNIEFLRLLKRFDMIDESQGLIYKEFIQNVLKKLANFFGTEVQEFGVKNDKLKQDEPSLDLEDFISPVIHSDSSTFNPDFEKLENLVDTSDGFLMNAFANFFVKQNVNKKSEKTEVEMETTLFEKISRTTTNLFPKTNFFESILLDILNDRFNVSGLLIKKLLIEKHLLEKQFEFLRHLFLFQDDLIFPFYRRVFATTHSSKPSKAWAYELWLTTFLQDVFTDLYPEFSQTCSVTIKEEYFSCDNPMKIFKLLEINYEIVPPINVIINKEQIEKYQEMFQFLLTLKWAIYTVNHLDFTDLEPKARETLHKSSRSTSQAKQLQQIKFCLINLLNVLQHFIFESVLNQNIRKFELNFENAKDLDDLISSHAEFANSTYNSLKDIRNCLFYGDKTNNVLNCIKLLKLLWSNNEYVTVGSLKECKIMYDDFYKIICPIVFPVSIYY